MACHLPPPPPVPTAAGPGWLRVAREEGKALRFSRRRLWEERGGIWAPGTVVGSAWEQE